MTEAVIIRKPVHWLQSKSMDWFLYDNGLHHERIKVNSIDSHLRSVFSTKSSIDFNWQNTRALCCDTTAEFNASSFEFEQSVTPIPQSSNNCLKYSNNTAWKVSLFGVFLVGSSRIRTEYGEIRSISPYSVRMLKNTDQ